MKTSYHPLLDNLIEVFKEAVEKGGNSVASQLTHIDLFRLNRVCIMEKPWESIERLEALRNASRCRTHDFALHRDILYTKPMKGDKVFVYFDRGDVVSLSERNDYASFLVVEYSKKYFYGRVEYNPETLCIEKLYTLKVELTEDNKLQMVTDRDDVKSLLKELLMF